MNFAHRKHGAARRWVAALAVAGTAVGLVAAAAPSNAIGPAPAYYPTGPQTNVAVSTVLAGGWKQCFQDYYANNLNSELPSVLSACDGDYLMLAGRATGSGTLSLLAAAPRSDVLFDTGTNTATTHAANGTGWYFNAHYSWGFAPAGDPVAKTECDIDSSPDNALRLCWHTTDNGAGGYRLGGLMGLNGSTAYQRLVFEPIGQLPQTITFNPIPNKTYGVAPFVVSATGGASGNPVTFSTTSPATVCTVASHANSTATVTVNGVGTCAVTADQAGSTGYAAATPVTRSFTINPAPLTVTPSRLSILRSAEQLTVHFRAVVTNAAVNKPAVGVIVVFRAVTTTGYNFGCTAITDSTGVATCHNGQAIALASTLPPTYTATASGANYVSRTATGYITLI